jgi:microsomal dipeptidase-like Zn-dependent dipeptidase
VPTIEVALPPWFHVPATCPPGTGGLGQPRCRGVSIHGIGGLADILNTAFSGNIGHPVGGYPEFDGWPRWNNYTGQQMYHEWLKRAHDGGLRLMVMMAVNNEPLCKAINRKEAFGCADMPAIERQLQAAHDLEAFLDGDEPGSGWFRIVRSSAEARAVIAAGKLAVVLGIETPSLFGCKSLAQPTCTAAFVLSELDRFHAMGVRHILPVHNADSGFAGTAFFHDALALAQRDINGRWWDVRSCPADSGVDLHLQLLDTINDISGWPVLGPIFAAQFPDLPPRPPAGPNCNNRGLTELGQTLVNGMIDRGMLIDVDHMSIRAFDDTLDLVGTRRYPGVISSHTGFVEMGKAGKGKRHEANKTAEQLQRLRTAGGMVSTILNQGTRAEVHEYRRPDDSVPVPFTCGRSSEAWAQAYLYAVEKMGGAPVAIGSDFNGFSGMPAPRFGLFDACAGDHDAFYEPKPGVEYPFTAHETEVSMEKMQVADRIFDYDEDGLANVGLLPDFIEDLKKVGLADADLAPLFGSAEAYIRIWEKADDRTPPVVRCGAADTAWHADNVSIACTASDAASGLAAASDATFTLATTVAAGEETGNAATGTRSVCDVRGNCATAGPIAANKVDRKAPGVSIVVPAATSYLHSAVLTLSYSATDGGSGIAAVSPTLDGQPTLAGHGLASGQAIDLLTELPLGDHTLVVEAEDAVGNAAAGSVTFQVIATTASVREAIRRMFDMGDIEKAGIARSLQAKLDAAEIARNGGACATAANIYQSFVNEVSAQTPVHIAPAAAAILLADVNYLSVHCP